MWYLRTSVTHLAAPCVSLFCSYHILTSSVVFYWTFLECNWVIYCYQLSWKRQLATVKSLKADVSSVSLITLRWPIYVFNSVDNTKLPCYTLPPTQHNSFSRNLPPLFVSRMSWIIWKGEKNSPEDSLWPSETTTGSKALNSKFRHLFSSRMNKPAPYH